MNQQKIEVLVEDPEEESVEEHSLGPKDHLLIVGKEVDVSVQFYGNGTRQYTVKQRQTN